MRRTQLMLKEEQHRFLADEARHRGISISALLRELIDERIQAHQYPPLKEDALWDMVGIAHSGADTISEEHDRYLGEARSERMSAHQKKNR